MTDEYFLDDAAVDDMAGVSRTISRPAKHASNPLVGDAAWTWDRDINYVSPRLIGGTVNLWYMGVETTPELYACLATSSDGIVFTRPNLGLITYGGNTNNNIMLAAHSTIIGVHYDATATPAYVAVGETRNASNDGVYIYSSSDGTAWTLIKTLYSGTIDGNYKEGRSITRRADGRYVVMYSNGHQAQRRSPGCYISDGSDPAGTWTHLGVVVDAKSSDAQRYHVSPAKVGDAFIALAVRYVKSTEQADKVELMASRDCIEWRALDAEWYAIGASGAWDDEMIFPSANVIEIGNDWWFYYTGFGANHAAALPRNALIGAVTIPKGRIASIGSTGTLRTKAIALGAADVLTVNCDASGGSLKAELLDERGQVIYGYSRDDCDPITTDTFGAAVTWAGRNLIASRTVKIVFVLASATLHSFQVAA